MRSDFKKPAFGRKPGGKSFGGGKPWERGGGDRGGFGGARREGGFKRGGFRDSREGGASSMHKATCATCSKSCMVPFAPRQGRPVFCSDCFQKDGGESSFDRKPSFGGRERGDFGGRPSFREAPAPAALPADLAQQLKVIQEKLDILLELASDE